mgnify:CR=1 FL=1
MKQAILKKWTALAIESKILVVAAAIVIVLAIVL